MKLLRNNQYFLPLKPDQNKLKKVIKQGYQSQHASPDILAAKILLSQLQKIQNLTMTTTDFAQIKNMNKSSNTFEKDHQLKQNSELDKKQFDESNKENRPLNSSLQKKHDRVVKSNIKQVIQTKDVQTINQVKKNQIINLLILIQQIHSQLPSQRNNQFYSSNNYGISECNNKVQQTKLSVVKKEKNQSREGKKTQQKQQKQNNNQKYYNLNQQLQKFQQKMTETSKSNQVKDKQEQKKNQEIQQQKMDQLEILTERINRNSVENIYSQFFENKENSLKPLNAKCISVIYCQNHPEKKSKYCTINQVKKIFCCSKCAVQLIKQGIQMQELELDEQLNDAQDDNLSKIEKHNQLTEFLQNIQQLDDNCLNIAHSINTRANEISEFYSQQIQKFQSFFIVLNKLIQNEEDKFLSDLQKQKEQSQMQYDKAILEVEHMRKELDNSKMDIKSNYENILNKMNLDAFYNTLNQYKDKMNNYQRTSDLFQNKQLQLTKYTFFKTDLSNFNKDLSQNINQMLSNIIIKQLNPVQFIKQQSQYQEQKSNSLFISFTQNGQLENLLGYQNSNQSHAVEQNCVINLDPLKQNYQTPKIFQKLKKPFNSYSLPDDKVKETLNLGLQQLESSKFLSLVDKYNNEQQIEKDNKILEIQELNPVQESIEFQKHCLPKNNFTFSKADNILNNQKLLESLTGNQIKQSIENYKRLNLDCGLMLGDAKTDDSNQILRIAGIDSPHFQEGSKRLEF